MSEEFEHAHENLEHAAHGHSHGESTVKPTAIIIHHRCDGSSPVPYRIRSKRRTDQLPVQSHRSQ